MVSPAGTVISSAAAATSFKTGSGTSLKICACFNAAMVSMEDLRSSGRRRWRRTVLRDLLLLPASAEGPVQEDDRGELVALRAGEAELRVEQLPLGVEHLEIAGDPALVSLHREPRRDCDRLHLI